MAESMADQADRQRASRDAEQVDEALKAQREHDAKTDEYVGAEEYVVTGPYVTLKMKNPAGGPLLVQGFNEGAVVKGEDVDEDNLRHHVDIRYVLPKDAKEARFAGPAGTPKPGEPPNVPVEEGMPVEMLPVAERLSRQQAAADKAEQSEQQSAAARTRAAPAGTPKPGEPPNVPVEEGMPVEMLPVAERLSRQQAAADKAEQSEQQSAAARTRAAKSASAKSDSDKTGS